MYSWIYIKKKKGEGAIIMDNYYIYIYIYIYYRKDNSYIDINLVSTDFKKKIWGGWGGGPLGSQLMWLCHWE